MPKYLPGGQLAECMRSGIKCLASQLVRDGRNPQLLVLPEWADPSHPQESPYVPNDDEGKAHYPIAPDDDFNVPPVLSLDLVLLTGTLTWTQADTIGPRVESYKVYRATGLTYVLLTTLSVDFGNGIDDLPVHPLTYTDATLAYDTQYTYRVDAFTGAALHLASNTETITTEATPTHYRLLETGSRRLMETTGSRLLET